MSFIPEGAAAEPSSTASAMRIWSTATCTPSGPSGAKCASRAARAAARAICDSNHAAETAMRSRDTRFLRRFSFARLS